MVQLTGSAAATQPQRDAADRPFTLIGGVAVHPNRPWRIPRLKAAQMRSDRQARRDAQANFLSQLDGAPL